MHYSINGERVDHRLAYSPQNVLLDRIMADVSEALNISVVGYPNAQTMESTLMGQNLLAGVEFGDSLSVLYPFGLAYSRL